MSEQVKAQARTTMDATYSLRHREYGWDVPATDVDWVEYLNGQPKAIIEVKGPGRQLSNTSSKSVGALLTLAQNSGIPFIPISHDHRCSEFVLLDTKQTLSEVEWVKRLYELRKMNPPEEILKALKRPAEMYRWKLQRSSDLMHWEDVQ